MYWSVILTGVAIALTIYYYFNQKLGYFEKTGIPHLRPSLLFGNMGPVVFKRRALAEQIKWIYDRVPDAKYVGFHLLTIPTIMLRDPEIIKYITVTKFDHFVNRSTIVDENSDAFYGKNLFSLRNSEWREMRTILGPSFTSRKLKGMLEIAASCGRKFVENLGSGTRIIDLKDNFSRYTMDVIATATLGITVGSLEDPDDEFYAAGKESTTLDYVKTLKILSFQLSPWLMKTLRIGIIADKDARFFTRIVRSTVAIREARGQWKNDMIQLMMEAKNSGKAPNLSIEDMAVQAFLFIFAGFESTSTAMSFAAYELAINPDIQDKLQAEIDAVRSTLEGEFTWEVFQDMYYLEAVVNEALRKYSPAIVTDRVCNKAVEIPPALPGAPSFILQPGCTLWIPFYALHRDPRYFEDPERFDPERFIDPATGKNTQPYGFMPFGTGPRICLGERFAVMEVKLALFHLLAKYRIEPCSKTRIPLTLSKAHFSLKAEHDYWVQISPRN